MNFTLRWLEFGLFCSHARFHGSSPREPWEFGRELLIAPVYNQTNQRDIYLPEGKWIDFWTKKEYFGPLNFKYYVGLEKLPIFIRNDSIIIYGQDKNFIENKPEKKLILDIYLDKRVEFIYYDDFETIKFSGIRNKNKNLFSISDTKYK